MEQQDTYRGPDHDTEPETYSLASESAASGGEWPPNAAAQSNVFDGPPFLASTVSPPTAPPLRGRFLPFLFLMGIFLLVFSLIPPVAEQIAYSLNRGAERAKAKVARELLNDLPEVEQRIPWVAKAVLPSVVGIQTLSATRQRRGMGMDVGSGVIVDETGYILTNNHVVQNAQFVTIRLNDGRTIQEVEIVGRDAATDLAVLRVNNEDLQAIQWGDSRKIEVGEQVIAIGNPYELGQTVTSGIISATERFNSRPNSPRAQGFLQTDAAINPGNSGGPLVNMQGELIGINTMIFSETGGSLGIGFAIPSFQAKTVYEEIIKHGEFKHGWLGIAMDSMRLQQARRLDLPEPKGVVVLELLPDSPASESGMKAGDVIVKWGETEVQDPEHLSHLIILGKPGQMEKVEVLRDGEPLMLDVTLGTWPEMLE